MAKRNSEAALRAMKERKQKIFLLCVAPLFLGLVAWQGPKTYHALKGAPPPPLPTVTTPATTGTTPGVTPTSTNALPDTDPEFDPLDGQLVSFSRFSGRDPFVPRDQGTSTQAAGSAALEVNGTPVQVDVNGTFPAGDPTFKLVAVSASSVQVGLVSGAFSSGANTVEITLGQTLVLQDDAGVQYSIKLVSVTA